MCHTRVGRATEPPAVHRARLFRFVFSDTSFCCRSWIEEEEKRSQHQLAVREENKGRPLTHLDLVRAQRALAALLLEALLDALEDLADEHDVVDAEEARQLRGAAAAGLEGLHLGLGRISRGASDIHI